MKTIRRPISILLAVLMVVGMFTMVPISAGAATWTFKLNSNFSGEWNADTDVVSEQPVELNLAAGDYEFQIIANDGTTTFYRGNEQAGSFTETYSQTMHDNGGNAKFHADGGKYTLTYNAGDGVLTINPVYVAEIDGTYYKTLADAFAAAQDGNTITLLADCTGDGIKVAKAKFATKGLTVNFNSHTYTVDGETVGSSGTETIGFQLLKGNKITFQNGTITGNSNTNQTLQRMIQNYSDLTLYNMTVSMVGRYNNQITVSTCNGKTVIKDSKISAPDFTWAGYDDPAEVGAAALAVGTFSSYPSIDVTVEGTSVINGDVNVSDSNNKKAFSLKLNGGELNGKINLDENAKAAIDDTASTANVTKADSFTQKAPEGYKWVDNGDGTSTLAPIPYVAKIGNAKYETLADAFAAAVDGDTITLLADCAGNGIKVTPAGKFANGLTVDFAGHTYTVDGETVGSTGTETNGFQLLKNNKVTFKNGKITSAKAKILVQNYSDLTLEGMELTLDNPNYTQGYTLSNNNGNIVIDGTTINANPAGGFAFDVCRFSSYPSVHVTVTGESKINGDVEISASKGQAKDGFSLTLESGTMTGDIVVDASAQALVGEDNKVTKANTFTQDPAEGFEWKDNGNGTSTLAPIPYVAKIGNAKYETLADAFAAAVDGDTITLLADCAGNGIKVTPAGKFANGLTVDFAGHTYTVDGETVGSTGTETNGFQLLKNNKVTFKNGKITSAKAKILVQNYSDLTLEGMELTLDNPNYTQGYTLSNNNGNIVIDGTTINANPAGGFAFDVCRFSSYPSVHVTVTGESKINGDVEISASKGQAKDGFSLTLESGTMTGDIVVDASAQALVGEDNKVTKANTFTQDPAEGFEWKDNGDGTSTLVKIPKLFTGHNITLRGDVSLNFFINTAAIENYNPSVPAKVVFTYDGTRTAEVDFADATPVSDGVIMATIQVPAAFMAHKIQAVVYYDGAAQAETDEYSIQQYAETLIADPAAYGIPAAKVDAVKTLMKEMLNYGAKAQTVFAGQVKEQAAYDDLTEKYDYHMASVTDADIQAAIDAAPQNTGKTATDLSTVKPEANATFYTASVVFLSESTLKIVFKVPGGSTITGYDGSQKNTYYWVQETDIAAAQLDTLQEFTVGDATFYYSALDYAKVVLKNGNAAAQDLVSALYLYNQAANGYFGANA